MKSKAIGENAFIVRRVPCGCVIAVSILEPRASRDLFDEYEDRKDFEIDIVSTEQARTSWTTRCTHETSKHAAAATK